MAEGSRYVLPIRVLLEIMRALSASVTVQAYLAALPEGWNEACVAELVLVQGLLHACTIRTTEGLMLLQQEAAYQMLQRLGTLEWSLGNGGEHGRAYTRADPPESHAVGTRVAPSRSSEALARLSRRHKQVLLLSESHKQPEAIARLLHLSVQEVEQILHP